MWKGQGIGSHNTGSCKRMLVYSCRLITVLRGHHSIKGHKYLILTINGSIHLGDFWKLLKSRCFTNAFSSPPRPSSVACLSCTSCPGDTWSRAFTKCVFGRPNACSTIMDRPWKLKKATNCLESSSNLQMWLSDYVYSTLYNKLSYAHILIGSHWWSIGGQTYRWCHH